MVSGKNRIFAAAWLAGAFLLGCALAVLLIKICEGRRNRSLLSCEDLHTQTDEKDVPSEEFSTEGGS